MAARNFFSDFSAETTRCDIINATCEFLSNFITIVDFNVTVSQLLILIADLIFI
jgi:hypothetical protein